MPEIKLTLDEGDAKTVAEALRANHVEWLAEIVERQLPKAPVEEPTEAYSLVRARWTADGAEEPVVFIRARSASEDAGSEYSWGTIDAEYSFAGMADPEVLRVGVGEPATPPTEAVEADEVRELRLDLQACHATLEAVALALREEADDIGANDPAADFLNKWADRIQPAAAEPTPEQVEADPAQDEQAHARYYAQAASAPAGDAIEALVASFVDLIWHGIDNDKIAWHNAARDLAARVLEVGGQQSGGPVVGK